MQADADLSGWPYERRGAALEALFADKVLEAPLTLCPSTTDPAVTREWLEWTATGLEGFDFIRLEKPYRPVWSRRKHKVRRRAVAAPARPHRIRTDVEVPQMPLFGEDVALS
ncbi:hypothetical protein AB0D42_33700 [Streptomyces sp. NPDC048304]|uniref:hypothetical protein n=1 Tax=Streptomyces sp. NPDC048304 TaxID=3154820 RepID=UPI003410F1F9